MINLFHVPSYTIDTSRFSHVLHDEVVGELEENFAQYVGAKYACTANSAFSLLFLSLIRYKEIVDVPSTMPIVVPNAVVAAGNKVRFYDDIDWVGHCYHLHDNIFDSAQEVRRNQYQDLNNDNAVVIFSFYPTKPVSGCDGGMAVSNNKDFIDYYKTMTMNGTSLARDSWDRKHTAAGYKMHCNSLQAFVANENLKKIDQKNDILDEISSAYNHHLGYNNTSRHLYRIRVRDNRQFISGMKNNGIQCGIHYEHCHSRSAFADAEIQPTCECEDACVCLSNSERESKSTVSLPFHENLNKQDIDKVVYNARKLADI